MLKFIADENIHNQIIINLREHGLNVVSIKESYPGISDIDIIETILDNNSVLLTEDSDFGKWVFVYKKQIGVIYLRYHFKDVQKISERLLEIITKYQDKLLKKFIVLTVRKIRIRNLQ